MIKRQIIYNFLKLLKNEGIKYEYKNDIIYVIGGNYLPGSGSIYLTNKNIEKLPDNIHFNNKGSVSLADNKIVFLPEGLQFNNTNAVYLTSNRLKRLPKDIQFNNGGNVYLGGNYIEYLPDGIKFNNKGQINFGQMGSLNNPLKSLPDNIDEFYDRLNIENKRYLRKIFPDHWIVSKSKFNL